MRRWLFALSLVSCGCDGDLNHLSRVCDRIGKHLDAATSGPRAKLSNGYQAARGEMGIDSRVATRLRWDRAMEASDVHVTSPDPGVIQLDGTVVDAAQQVRAGEIAAATVGVEKVENKLTVVP
jgi:osmotically-inducible protein OsmY